MTPTETPEPESAADDALSRLLAFVRTTLPVLSVYLNTQPDQHGRDPELKPYLQREFKALARTWQASSPERQSFDRDAERILAYTEEHLNPAANGIAIFACSGAEDFFEAIQLQTPIHQSRVYAYNQPHLYELARAEGEYPKYAALIADANTARIFVFGLGQTLESEDVKGAKVHRVKVGGWSQARYQRRVNNAHQKHAKEVIARLEQIVSDENIRHVILAGEPAILSLLREEMPKPLAEMVVDSMKLDVNSSAQEILAATLEKMREEGARTDAEQVDRLLQEYRAHGLAVVGPEETLKALALGQVDELLITASLDDTGTEAPAIGEPQEPSLPEQLIMKAKLTDANVLFIQDPGLLRNVEGVGAFLRWS